MLLKRLLFVSALLAAFVAPLSLPVSAVAPAARAEGRKECVVYVTRTGNRYHKGWCSYLRYSKFRMSRNDAIARGLTPCLRCGGSDCEQ
jgi:hypothetical protein